MSSPARAAVVAVVLVACGGSPRAPDTGAAPVDAVADGDTSEVANDAASSCPPKSAFLTAAASRVRLRGANVYQQDESRADSGGDFGPTLAADDLRALRAAGANLVNLSVPGTWHVRGRKPWPEMRAHLDRIVDWAQDAGLFVIVSFRTGPGRGEGDLTGDGLPDRSVFTDAADQEAWASMWRELATDYRARRNVVAYDLMVEPHDVTDAAWRAVAQRAIDAIRVVDADTAIVVGATDWSGASALAGYPSFTGAHLAVGVHQYEPYAYTHQAATSWTPAQLDSPFAAIDAFVAKTGAAVAVNELGIRIDKSGADAFIVAELERLEARALDHAVWLWEVADPSGYRAFDVRSSTGILASLKTAWAANTSFADGCR